MGQIGTESFLLLRFTRPTSQTQTNIRGARSEQTLIAFERRLKFDEITFLTLLDEWEGIESAERVHQAFIVTYCTKEWSLAWLH
mgnify:CR=1 FL=1|jgi:hypothetical protein